MNQPRSRVGVFGGSFDPVHQGHLALAWHALHTLQLDQVRWIPSHRPWQKTSGPHARRLAPVRDRCAMVALAIAQEPQFKLDLCEALRPGASYTIDTLSDIRNKTESTDLVLLLGQDQYANIHTWHRWRDVLVAATLAVTARGDQSPQAAPEVTAVWHRLKIVTMPPSDVSSTEIRARLATGARPMTLVPGMLSEPVARYIAQRGLYSPPPLNRFSTPDE